MTEELEYQFNPNNWNTLDSGSCPELYPPGKKLLYPEEPVSYDVKRTIFRIKVLALCIGTVFVLIILSLSLADLFLSEDSNVEQLQASGTTNNSQIQQNELSLSSGSESASALISSSSFVVISATLFLILVCIKQL